MRNITSVKIVGMAVFMVEGKYVIVGCENGCIEVYDTDTLECLYGFGLTKFGPIVKLEVNEPNKSIFGLDSEGDVYMARFGKA